MYWYLESEAKRLCGEADIRGADGWARSSNPILEGRGPIDGRAMAYVCVDSICRSLVTEPEELLKLIEQAVREQE